MVVIKDGKEYYTFDESSKILDEMIEKDAKEFAKEVIQMQKETKKINQIAYV